MIKYCSQCKQEAEFTPKGRMCRKCNRAYQRAHYLANKGLYRQGNYARRNQVRKDVQEIKQRTPCADCGIQYPYYVADYHHLDSALKEEGISRMIGNGCSLATIQKEISKCELVCSNCHRERTHQAPIG